MFKNDISSSSSRLGDLPTKVCFEFSNVFGPSGRDAGQFVTRGLFGVDRSSNVGVSTAEHKVHEVAVGPFTHRGMAYKA